MVSSVYWEWEFFINTIKLGVKIAFIYDGILILRLIFFHGKFLISMEDLIYWGYVAVTFFQYLLELTDGVLRGYSILGIFIGMFLYHRLLGEKIVSCARKWIGRGKRRLTAIYKMIRMKVDRRWSSSGVSRREDGKKKSNRKKRTKSSGNDYDTGDFSVSDAGSVGEKI